MEIEILDTIKQYEELLIGKNKREDYFRYSMMKPLEQMWNLINVPLKSGKSNGYDVVMATKMLGFIDVKESNLIEIGKKQFQVHDLLQVASDTVGNCLSNLEKNGLSINSEKIVVGTYLGDPLRLKLQNGYCGFGGIPGFIQLVIVPNNYTIPRFPALIAHELHHNFRFSHFPWDQGNVSVGDYLVIEGLAESFAKELYGEELMGPWVSNVNSDELNYSIQIIKDALGIKGFAEVSSYMFGDSLAKEQGYFPVGLPDFAGYAVGYHLIQNFMECNNKSIYETSQLVTQEIIQGSSIFK